MMKLRPIQETCIQNVYESFKAGGTYHLVQASVAFGKTVISSEIMRRSLDYGAKCLFLAHLQELVAQTVEKFNLVAPDVSCGVFMGARKDQQDITVGTRQTIEKNLDLLEPVNLIIVDEVHLWCAQYQKIVDHFLALNPRLRVLGVTGTPFNSKGWLYGDGKMWTDPCFVAHIDQMIELGYLSPFRYKMAEELKELDSVSVSGGEFNENEMEKLLVEERHMGSVQKAIDEHAQKRKRILIFAVTIDHAEKLAEFLGCAAVHSKLDKAIWRELVDAFKSGEVRMLVNVSQLSIGFDCPEVDCVVNARPTMSPALHVQICGRGLRIAHGKTDCLIIDLVGNYLRHGLPSHPTVRDPREKQEGKEKEEMRSRVCFECFSVVEGPETICPFCGADMTAKKEIIENNAMLQMKEIEIENQKKYISKMWVKANHRTEKGYWGSMFMIKLTGYGDTLFKFCSNGSKQEQLELHRLALSKRKKIKCTIVNTAYGEWVDSDVEQEIKDNLRESMKKGLRYKATAPNEVTATRRIG
jgi:DNA repair protein RadD